MGLQEGEKEEVSFEPSSDKYLGGNELQAEGLTRAKATRWEPEASEDARRPQRMPGARPGVSRPWEDAGFTLSEMRSPGQRGLSDKI